MRVKWDCVSHLFPSMGQCHIWGADSGELSTISYSLTVHILKYKNTRAWISIQETWQFCLEQLMTDDFLTPSAVQLILFFSLSHPMSVNSFVWNAQIRGLIRPEVSVLSSVAWSGQGVNSFTSVDPFSDYLHWHKHTRVLFFSCLSVPLRCTSTAVLKIDFCHFQWPELTDKKESYID